MQQSPSQKLSLRSVLVVPFVLQIFAAARLTGYLSLRNGQKAVNEVAGQLRQEVTSRVTQNLQTYLLLPTQINQVNQQAIAANWLPTDSVEPWQKHLWQQVNLFPNVGSIGIGTEKGEFIAVGKNESGAVVLNIASQRAGFAYDQCELDAQGNPGKLLKKTPNFQLQSLVLYLQQSRFACDTAIDSSDNAVTLAIALLLLPYPNSSSLPLSLNTLFLSSAFLFPLRVNCQVV
jgi:hypothetical protein